GFAVANPFCAAFTINIISASSPRCLLVNLAKIKSSAHCAERARRFASDFDTTPEPPANRFAPLLLTFIAPTCFFSSLTHSVPAEKHEWHRPGRPVPLVFTLFIQNTKPQGVNGT